MQEDDRKLNSWWQSSWASAYLKTMTLGIVIIAIGLTTPNMPVSVRILFTFIGLVITIASYFSAKSRWKKI